MKALLQTVSLMKPKEIVDLNPFLVKKKKIIQKNKKSQEINLIKKLSLNKNKLKISLLEI